MSLLFSWIRPRLQLLLKKSAGKSHLFKVPLWMNKTHGRNSTDQGLRKIRLDWSPGTLNGSSRFIDSQLYSHMAGCMFGMRPGLKVSNAACNRHVMERARIFFPYHRSLSQLCSCWWRNIWDKICDTGNRHLGHGIQKGRKVGVVCFMVFANWNPRRAAKPVRVDWIQYGCCLDSCLSYRISLISLSAVRIHLPKKKKRSRQAIWKRVVKTVIKQHLKNSWWNRICAKGSC